MTTIRSVDSLKYGAGLFSYLFVVLVVGGGLVGLGLEVGYSAATDLAGTGGLGTVDTTDLAAGGVLSLLGSFVVLTGVFGLTHKLLADSVAAGVATGTDERDGVASQPASETTTAVSDEPADQTTSGRTGPSPGEQSARRHGVSTTVPPAVDAGQGRQSGATAGDSTSQPAEGTGTTATAGEPSLSEMFDGSAPGERVEPGGSQQGDTDTETTADADPSRAAETDEGTPPREPTPEEIAFGTASEAVETEAETTDDPSTATGDTSGTDPLAEPDDE